MGVFAQTGEFISDRCMFFTSTDTDLGAQNYVADWIMSLSWGLCQGLCSPIPYFYSVFFIVVLIHRCGRDFER